MPIASHSIKAGQPYTVSLSFTGIAKYSVTEYVPNGDGWKVGNVVQPDGNSADAQADVYSLTPLSVGDRRLVAIGGNMSSATGEDDVAMLASFSQADKDFHTDKQTGRDNGGVVVLWSRTVFVGI
jgi:hypothetical protein